jgi:hypothetical protein
LGKTLKKTIMGYGMKYTKGGFPFKSSPAKQKVDPDAPGTPGTPGFEPPVQPGGPMEMHSPNKIYGVGGERRKNYTY